MALKPINIQHAVQIKAGTEGRKSGHKFEDDLADLINNISTRIDIIDSSHNVVKGDPSEYLVQKALSVIGWDYCDEVRAIPLGSLATAEDGKKWLDVNGVTITACKSDILLTLSKNGETVTVGVSVKQCNTKSPTNAQLYFTTAQAFCNLLRNNSIPITNNALEALKQFCGDDGFRPENDKVLSKNRQTDPRRFFWEEIHPTGKIELEELFTTKQDEITRLLLQKAYLNDPFSPELLIHKTKKISSGPQEYAIYSIEELINLSKKYANFNKKPYSVRKGSYKDPIGVLHEAPRFGIVQMQRGGQQQHPTQLQFNLQAGYFYKLDEMIKNKSL